ncbi:MFS general substrate transporter [Mycena indigotica]|uniref:MFS general substrate transporter n=1 Tax=Mycena indigotica TaxID=2126181 RepID=A0A8H6W5U4_9AGAR|nr:MFS general substrate transporter [Mycena indigotica]KAF7306899.1 MFS general substrate transporter [Mycena indigotica]
MESVSKSLDIDDLERKVTVSSPDRDSEIIEFTREEELQLLRKFDFMILPPLAFMYLCNALDKGNVGNAKTAHWDKDIGLTGDQYYILVMVFYAPFCVFGTPLSLFAKRFSAARVLPIVMLGFVEVQYALEQGALYCRSKEFFSQFLEVFAIRFFLGIFESPMLPAVVYYLSTFYKRNELASRVATFYAAASISGAFSGLIAYGVFHITNTKYHNWQYLFWIEGAATLCFAAFAWFWLPRTPATWRFLTDRQKAIARSRILSDSSATVEEGVDVTGAFSPFKSPLYWVWILISISLGVPLASVNNFLPQIISSFKYSTVKTNLYTVAPNVAGTVALLLLAFSSDYFRERTIREHASLLSELKEFRLTWICRCIPLVTAFVGFIILGSIDTLQHLHVAYFACFLLTMGAFAPSILVATWYSNNTTHESKRAAVAAVMVGFANSAGLISTNVFRAQDEPKYVPALATSAAFGGFCLILVAGTGIWMRRENARRNREQGVNLQAKDVDTSNLSQGTKSPLWRYMY